MFSTILFIFLLFLLVAFLIIYIVTVQKGGPKDDSIAGQGDEEDDL